jgi:hypothetical protein
MVSQRVAAYEEAKGAAEEADGASKYSVGQETLVEYDARLASLILRLQSDMNQVQGIEGLGLARLLSQVLSEFGACREHDRLRHDKELAVLRAECRAQLEHATALAATAPPGTPRWLSRTSSWRRGSTGTAAASVLRANLQQRTEELQAEELRAVCADRTSHAQALADLERRHQAALARAHEAGDAARARAVAEERAAAAAALHGQEERFAAAQRVQHARHVAALRAAREAASARLRDVIWRSARARHDHDVQHASELQALRRRHSREHCAVLAQRKAARTHEHVSPTAPQALELHSARDCAVEVGYQASAEGAAEVGYQASAEGGGALMEGKGRALLEHEPSETLVRPVPALSLAARGIHHCVIA